MIPRSLLENDDLRVRRCRYGFMLYSLHDIYMGRAFERYGEYGEREIALYRQLIRPGHVVIDAGANIGSFTVFFAKAVGHEGLVHAFEPQRVIYHMLCANLALNRLHNVISHFGAVGAAPGRITVPDVDYGKTNNFGGLSLKESGDGEEVPVLTIDGLGLERCDLIKIDVQGMEGDVLTGAAETIARFQPHLYVENDLKGKSRALIGQLFDLGYRLYWHIPRLFNPKNFFKQDENIYGNTVSVNMICLPKGDMRKVDLRQITSVDDWWKTEAPKDRQVEPKARSLSISRSRAVSVCATLQIDLVRSAKIDQDVAVRTHDLGDPIRGGVVLDRPDRDVVPIEGEPFQHGDLAALDVKRHKIGVGQAVRRQDVGQGAGLDSQQGFLMARIGPNLFQNRRVVGDGEARHLGQPGLDLDKLRHPGLGRDRHAQAGAAAQGARSLQLPGRRFYQKSSPAPVKLKEQRVGPGIAVIAADVDEGSTPTAAEQAVDDRS